LEWKSVCPGFFIAGDGVVLLLIGAVAGIIMRLARLKRASGGGAADTNRCWRRRFTQQPQGEEK